MTKNIPFDFPFQKFSEWFEKAKSNTNIIEPTAACLATVDKNLQPSARMILLKKFDQKGFCFFTNLNSRKSKELINNPRATLCFYWGILGFQIRIEGTVEPTSEKEADEYFASRSYNSQIGAWSSKQSSEIKDWSELEERIAEIEKKFPNQNVPRPQFWSGFRLIPQKIEFWKEGKFRLHQRELFERSESNEGWKITKLYP